MFSFVITTINIPRLLIDYHKQLMEKQIAHNFIVVPDLKTPSEAKEITKDIGGEYLERDTFGIRNDDARRQEGILRAIERKDDFIVLLDDDNFLGDSEVYEHFSRVGKEIEMPAWYSTNNWVNIWDDSVGKNLYPRGFPYSKRGGVKTEKIQKEKVVVNAGLWLENPDFDAIHCLMANVKITMQEGEFLLGKNQYCPINSQNTAYLGETLGGYYYPPKYNKKFKVGRFGDIFAGIFYEKIMHHLGGTVLFGRPFSRHIRNTHDYLKDLEWELMGMIILEDILPSLEEIQLTEKTWEGCLVELLDKLKGQRKETNEYLNFYRKQVEGWVRALQKTK